MRKRVDDLTYTIRFTPRRPTSIWSAANVKRIAELEKLGTIMPAGRSAFEQRKDAKTSIYAYEQGEAQLDPAHEQQFRASKKAWEFFQSHPPWLRRREIWRVIHAKRPETRQRRFEDLFRKAEQGIRLDQ